ncbi:MAG: tyrosine--tRNA ligase [Planctomycetota bacterium]|jgi:tyrosyl-tRNA synthetase|nr:tyrosine--tRNA ligase [Planctomycetota bacterium]
MPFKSAEEQMSILRRGVDQILSESELLGKLKRSVQDNQPLRIKLGIDPTAVDVHLGHTVPLRKLRQFQDLGHHIILIMGNYTALVGDPSGRDETRTRLSAEAVTENAATYLEQVAKVIDLSRCEVRENGDWFSRMTFTDVLELTSKITMMRLLERDDFNNRIKEQKAVYLHECLYPLMQGWDSVQVKADVELGGTDQLFNLHCGRDLQKDQGQEPQVAITMPILVGTDGQRRMGKSLGNYIGISESPNEMFGKLMSIADSLMQDYFELLTDIPSEEIADLLSLEAHPRDTKIRLSGTVVENYYGSELADTAKSEFERRFAQNKLPTDIPEKFFSYPSGEKIAIVPFLSKELGLASSGSEVRRLIQQGGVWVENPDNRLTDPHQEVSLCDGMLFGVGKRRVVRVRLNS